MTRPALLGVTAAMLAVGFAAGADSRSAPPPTTLPDLRIELPPTRHGSHDTPQFVDAFAEPGKLLYRFDAVIRNDGGILDVYRRAQDGHVMQAVHEGGLPAEAPDPSGPTRPGPKVKIVDRTSASSSFVYAREPTHEHWHYLTAAAYEITGQRQRRKSAKVGFCLHDTFADEEYFVPEFRTTGPLTWCGPDQPDSAFTHMGISPGAGDLYDAQDDFQWLDVTGFAPGRYSLSVTANPFGMLQETTRKNNTTTTVRTIPGTVASEAHVNGPGPLTVPLTGEVVGANLPARSSGDCQPPEKGTACYVRASASGPLRFAVVRPPAHGTVTVGALRSLTAEAAYTPAAGYTGADSFAYTVTDARGLTSAPATALVRVGPAGPVKSARVLKRGRRRVLALDLSAPATVSGRISGSARGKLRGKRVRRGRVEIALPSSVGSSPGAARLSYVVKGKNGTQRGTLRFHIA